VYGQYLDSHSFPTRRSSDLVADLLYFKIEKDIPKDGKVTDIVSSSSPILVQVAKEPISSKGPRLSAEITLAGRYLVLVPFSDKRSEEHTSELQSRENLVCRL